MTINLTPAQPTLQAQHLEELISLFLADCRARLPELTVDGYQYKLDWFLSWWKQIGPACGFVLRKSDLLRFARWLKDERGKVGVRLSYNSRKDILRRLRQVFHWANANGYTDGRDYAVWVPRAEGGAPLRKAATLDQLQRLLDATSRTPHPARNYALLATLIGTGIRRSELANLRVQDIQFYADLTGTALIRGKRTEANPTGERYVALDHATAEAIAAYITTSHISSGALFCGHRAGVALSPQGVYKVVKLAVKLAGLSEDICACHDMRRAFATRAQNNDATVQKQLGHASPAMTAHYKRLDIDDVRDVLISPLEALRRRKTE